MSGGENHTQCFRGRRGVLDSPPKAAAAGGLTGAPRAAGRLSATGTQLGLRRLELARPDPQRANGEKELADHEHRQSGG